MKMSILYMINLNTFKKFWGKIILKRVFQLSQNTF